MMQVYFARMQATQHTRCEMPVRFINSRRIIKRMVHSQRSPLSFLLIAAFTLGVVGFSAHTQRDGLQYCAVKVGSDRDIDDSFNEMAEEGWYPRFVLKFEGDARLIYERPREEEERVYGLKYKAEVIKRARQIDDTFNKMAKDGWFPRFVFRTGALKQNWRLMMERDPEDDVTNFEYRAVVLDEGRQVDDKFNQLSADGWDPLFVIQGADDHRMLFVRDPNNTERAMKFMAKVTSNIKQIDDLYNEHGEDGWEPMFLFQDENDAFRSLFQKPLTGESHPLEYQARRIEEMSQIDDKFNQYGADGWYPMFVIRDIDESLEDFTDLEGNERTRSVEDIRWRMLFGRAID